MNKPLDKSLRKFLLENKNKILFRWFGQVYQQQARHQKMIDLGIFSESDIKDQYNDGFLDVPLKLHPGTIGEIVAKFRKIIEALEKENITLMELFDIVNPVISLCYRTMAEDFCFREWNKPFLPGKTKIADLLEGKVPEEEKAAFTATLHKQTYAKFVDGCTQTIEGMTAEFLQAMDENGFSLTMSELKEIPGSEFLIAAGTQICISDNDTLTNEDVERMISKMPNLKKLTLKNCPLITVDIIPIIAKHCQALEVLNLSNNFQGESKQATAEVIAAFPHLNELILDNCGNLNTVFLTTPMLKKISILGFALNKSCIHIKYPMGCQILRESKATHSSSNSKQSNSLLSFSLHETMFTFFRNKARATPSASATDSTLGPSLGESKSETVDPSTVEPKSEFSP
jgi:hypothetical protein